MTKRRYAYVDFRREPVTGVLAKATHAIATAADDQEDYTRVGEQGTYFEYKQTGASALIFPTASAAGWALPVDQANGDGNEWTQGIIAGVPTTMKFVTGTDAFFIKCTVTQTILADYDVFMVGFRELGAYVDITDPATALSVYDSKVLIGTNDGVGTVVANTSINNVDTATALTNTPIVTATAVTWEIRVAANRAITFYVNGVADILGNAAGLLAEAAQTWVPCIVGVATAAAGGGNLTVVSYECGLL